MTVPGESDKGFAALDKIVQVSPKESRLWWKARLACFDALERRGTARDLRDLAGGRRSAARNDPGFASAEKFGLAARLNALHVKYP